MERARKLGRMGPAIKVSMLRARSTARGPSSGLMAARIMGTSLIITSRASEFTTGVTREFTKVNGKTIRWREKGFSRGLMAGSTKGNIATTRRKAKGSSRGRTDASTRASGLMGSRTASGPTRLTPARRAWASGKTGSGWRGFEFCVRISN